MFSNLTLNIDVWTLPIDSNKGKVLGQLQPVIQSVDEDMAPSISSDSRHLVFLSSRSRGIPSARKRELDTGKEVALTEDPRAIVRALVSPDGSKVVYQPLERNKREIYLTDYDGGPPRKICENCGPPLDWSGDGSEILYHWGQPIRFSLLNVASGKTRVVLQHPKYDLHRGQISPDRHWIAFHVPIDSSRSPVFLAPLIGETPPKRSDWISIADGSGLETHPFWSPDGNLIYFMSHRDGFRCIWAQRSILQPSNLRELLLAPITSTVLAAHSLTYIQDCGGCR